MIAIEMELKMSDRERERDIERARQSLCFIKGNFLVFVFAK